MVNSILFILYVICRNFIHTPSPSLPPATPLSPPGSLVTAWLCEFVQWLVWFLSLPAWPWRMRSFRSCPTSRRGWIGSSRTDRTSLSRWKKKTTNIVGNSFHEKFHTSIYVGWFNCGDGLTSNFITFFFIHSLTNLPKNSQIYCSFVSRLLTSTLWMTISSAICWPSRPKIASLVCSSIFSTRRSSSHPTAFALSQRSTRSIHLWCRWAGSSTVSTTSQERAILTSLAETATGVDQYGSVVRDADNIIISENTMIKNW